jgi:hypothetical protein
MPVTSKPMAILLSSESPLCCGTEFDDGTDDEAEVDVSAVVDVGLWIVDFGGVAVVIEVVGGIVVLVAVGALV